MEMYHVYEQCAPIDGQLNLKYVGTIKATDSYQAFDEAKRLTRLPVVLEKVRSALPSSILMQG